MLALPIQQAKWRNPELRLSRTLLHIARELRPRHDTRDVGEGGGGTISPSNERIVFTTISLLCMLLLAIMFGSRAHTLFERKSLRNMTFIRMLVYLLYICAMTMVATVAIMESGLDLQSLSSCRAAIYICLVFYVSCKVLVQMFLVERAHAARYMLKQRRDDRMW